MKFEPAASSHRKTSPRYLERTADHLPVSMWTPYRLDSPDAYEVMQLLSLEECLDKIRAGGLFTP
jgi:hypothetical protein